MKGSYFFQLMFQQLSKRKLTYILLFLQVAISSFLIVVVYALINYFGFTYDTLNKFKDQDVLIVPYNRLSSSLVSAAAYDDRYEELKNISGILAEHIYKAQLRSKPETSKILETVFVYEDIMTENIVLNLKKGVQLSEAEIKDSAYPVIVPEFSPFAEKCDTGEVFELYYIDKNKTENGHITDDSFSAVSFYVCGVIKYPYRVYSHQTSGIPAIIENFVIRPFTPTGNFFLSKNIEISDGLWLSDINSNYTATAIVEITAPIGSEEYQQAYEEISSDYGSISIKELLKVGYTNYSEGIGDYIVALIILVMLSIAGISGINLFLADALKQEYSLYFMCGARWSTCVLLDAVRSLLIILIPAVFGAAAGYIFIMSDTEVKYFLDIKTALCTVFFIAAIYAVTSLYFLIKIKNTKPIDNIRLMEKE